MIYPPPPGLAFLAYMSGSITKAEFLYLTKLWHEKHRLETLEEADAE